jgi:methionyl-tRNA synthetase
MPSTAKNIWGQLGMKEDIDKVGLSDAKSWGKLKEAHTVNKANPLFPRIDVKVQKS